MCLLPIFGCLQAQTLASETFDTCYTGALSCPDWAGDGFVEELRGDNILVLSTDAGKYPAATWHPASVNVAAGRTYRISAAMRAENLSADVALVARIQSDSVGAERFAAKGAKTTSSWQRLNLTFTPSTNGSLRLSVETTAAGQDEIDSTSGPSSVLIDDVIVAESASTLSGSYFSNVCPDGQFANLARSEHDCEDLHVATHDLGVAERGILRHNLHIDTEKVLAGNGPLGFDHLAPVTVLVARPDGSDLVSDCSHEAIQSAIDAAIAGRIGVVRLPECVIPIDEPILIEDAVNLVVEGSGIGLTVIDRRRGARPRPAILVKRSQNVILRDLSLKLNNLPQANIQIDRSDNVLIERITLSDAGSSSIRSSNSTRVSLRYNTTLRGPKSFSDAGCQGHWFASDQPSSNDRNRDGKGSTDECEQKWSTNFEPGSVWSAGYSAYSNVAYENSFSLHLTLAEIAGNRFIRTAGNKVADGGFVWLHDNVFEGHLPARERIATFRTSRDGILDRTPSHIVIYDNVFSNNANAPLRIMDSDVFVIDNQYLGSSAIPAPGAKRVLKLGRISSICSGTTEHALLLSGDLGKNPPRVVEIEPGGVCDLTDPGRFWSGVQAPSSR